MTTATMTGGLGRIRLLTADEERDLARRRDEGDPGARNELAERNVPLAVKLARAFARPRPWLLDDLIGASMLGLIEAADRFDPGREVRFGTYASHWIRRAMHSWLKDEAHLVRVPRYLHDALSLARRGLPYDATRANPERFRAATLALAAAAPGTWPYEDAPDPLARLLAATDAGPGDREGREWADRLLARLGGRGADVLRLRFGLGGEGPMSLAEVGDRLGLAKETIRKDQRRALAVLASLLETER